MRAFARLAIAALAIPLTTGCMTFAKPPAGYEQPTAH